MIRDTLSLLYFNILFYSSRRYLFTIPSYPQVTAVKRTCQKAKEQNQTRNHISDPRGNQTQTISTQRGDTHPRRGQVLLSVI